MSTKKIIDNTRQLIAIPSTADNPMALEKALGVISGLLAACPNITIERFESEGKPSLLAYRGSTRPTTFAVMLNGHVDVVPGEASQFVPRINNGRLYGRGALDMKTATVVLTHVFCKLAGKVSYPLGLQIVADEELAGHNGTAYQLKQGVKAEFVICGEFTPPGAIGYSSKGVYQVRLHFKGIRAHSARLWSGDNAVLAAQRAVDRLLSCRPVPGKPTGETTINVSSINTPPAAANQVPNQATVVLDIRYAQRDRNFVDEPAAIAFLNKHAPGAEVEKILFEPTYFSDPLVPLGQKLAAALSRTTGTKARFVQQPGAADTRYYTAMGTPAFIMGLPGEGMHGSDEYVCLDYIDTYRQAVELFLRGV